MELRLGQFKNKRVQVLLAFILLVLSILGLIFVLKCLAGLPRTLGFFAVWFGLGVVILAITSGVHLLVGVFSLQELKKTVPPFIVWSIIMPLSLFGYVDILTFTIWTLVFLLCYTYYMIRGTKNSAGK